jgi:hypothetical protein
MRNGCLKKVLVAAALAVTTAGAHAATAILDFDYMATGFKGDFAAASGGTAVKVGTLTLTDLADLHLGDGKSGVRISLALTGLDQFSSGTGAIFVSSYELSFPGTRDAGPGGSELSSATEGVNWRYVSGLNINTARAGGPIEFGENGSINGWGAAAADPAFEQEINFATTGTLFGDGLMSTIDFLNGTNGYNGFSVAGFLSNPVHNTDPTRPDRPGDCQRQQRRLVGAGDQQCRRRPPRCTGCKRRARTGDLCLDGRWAAARRRDRARSGA